MTLKQQLLRYANSLSSPVTRQHITDRFMCSRTSVMNVLGDHPMVLKEKDYSISIVKRHYKKGMTEIKLVKLTGLNRRTVSAALIEMGIKKKYVSKKNAIIAAIQSGKYSSKEEVHKEFDVPMSTLNRYIRENNLQIYF